ncbi:MAG TPA: phosphonatase-like hydrolase [Acidimicrobiales bacterium]|jgi:phosphonatase-like hydrolase|nr:phosphonatase-like hydrolase [Acidimicrobiales bacterium]
MTIAIQPIRLACLDMAGTTVSDGGVVAEAFTLALATAGLERGSPGYDEATHYVRQTMGQSKIEVFRAVFPGDERTAVTANEAFEAAYRVLIMQGRVAPIPGAEETFDALRRHGVQVCLTTGFSPTTRDAVLAALGWGDRADLVLSPADCGRGRPYPDMILCAILRLGIDDVHAVAVVGDTTSDLLAGYRSGAAIVAGVLTGEQDESALAAAPHTHLLASVADLPGLLFPGS